MPRYQRTEIWSDLQAAGGTRLAVVPDVRSLTDLRRLTGEDQLTLGLPISSPAWAAVRAQRVVRVVYNDGTFDEWRISQPNDERGSDGLVGTVTGVSIVQDLARSVVSRTEADGSVWYDFEALSLTIAQHLQHFILPALAADGFSWIITGTIEPAAGFDLAYSSTTPLTALKQLAQAAGAELTIRRVGTTQYAIDVLNKIGSSAATRRIRLGKDLAGVRRQTVTSDLATRVIPRGTAEDGIYPTMARAAWKVTGVSGSNVVLADPDGGAGPIAYDNQLNGLYLQKADGTRTQITASAKASQQITVASATGVSVGQLLEIRKNSTGDDLTYLESPTDKVTYGLIAKPLDRQDIPGTINLLANPALASWSGGLPVGFSKLGSAVVAQESSPVHWQTGGASAHVETVLDGDGIETAAAAITPSAGAPYFSGFLSFYLASGRVRVELVASDGTTTTMLPDGSSSKAFSTESGTWIQLGIAGVDLNALAATSAKLRIVQDGPDPAEFWLDAVQLTQTATHRPFIAGSGPRRLWQAANAKLAAVSAPQVQIAVDLIDLHRIDPTVFASEQLMLGGAVRVEDSALGLDVTTRFSEIQRDLLAYAVSKVVVSTQQADLAQTLAPVDRASRRIVSVDAPTVTYPMVQIDRIAIDDSSATYQVSAIAPLGVPVVRLAGIDGTTISAGAALGVLVASGSTWTVARPAADQPEAKLVFEAVLDGVSIDSDAVYVPSQGEGTIALVCQAVAQSTNATQMVVRVTVTDPVPGAGAYITLTPAVTGCAVSPNTPQTVASGGYVDFTVTRPAFQAGTGRFSVVATAAGRVMDSDAVELPAQERDTQYCECQARIIAADATSVTVQVDVTAPSGTPQVQLVAVAGSAAKTSGPAVGAASPSGTQWVFSRGAFQAGAGQAQFRATLAGLQNDDDYVEIPEQGRDTVALTAAAAVTSTTPSQVVVRVTVTDPVPSGSADLALAVSTLGCTITPSDTVSLASGAYRDFTIDRPAFGVGAGRVVFTVTKAGRVPDTDAIDVPEQDRDTIPLQASATVIDTQADHIDVRVTVTDPVSSGAADLAIAEVHSTNIASVSVLAGTSPVVSGGHVDYRITRPTAGSATGRVVFSSTKTGRVADTDAVDVPAQDPIAPTLVPSVTQGATSYSIGWTSNGTVQYQIDGGAWTNPAVGEPPITVARNAVGGADKLVTLKATLNGQQITQSLTVPVQAITNPSLGSIVVTKIDGTHFKVEFSPSNVPSGTTYNVTWSVDGMTPGGNADSYTSGSSITTPATMGSSPSAQVRVDAVYNGQVVTSKAKNGFMAL